MLRTRAAITIALVVVASLLLAPTSEAATRTRTYTYVATDTWVVGPDLVADTLRNSTPPEVPALAPLGTIQVVPIRDRLTLTIDDAGIVPRIHVSISRPGFSRALCIAAGRATVIKGMKRGVATRITVHGPWHGVDHCLVGRLRATTGTATVTL